MLRRQFLRGSAALLSTAAASHALAADTPAVVGPAAARLQSDELPLAPIRASADRIIEMNVCTRPFRPQGPRIELERIGRRQVVHNYGHGGSGWSLSWGSGLLATQMAQSTGAQRIAIVGCGAIGLTTALVAQQAGLSVTIYASERPPYVRSQFATGSWTPDSRICTAEFAAPFAERWEAMARYSFRRYQALLGAAGDPVEWRDMYSLSERAPGTPSPHGESTEPEYPDFEDTLLADLTPRAVDLSAYAHPFPTPYVRRRPALLFNIASYSRLLLEEFERAGGRIETLSLRDRGDFAAIDERTIINCTGYGARALLNDDTIIPVRGQTCKLIPQPEVHYGLNYGDRRVSVYPRRDGMLVQAQAEGDFNNDKENLDPQESISAVERLAQIVHEMKLKG